MSLSTIRLLLAEDQSMVREALAALLGLEPDIEVVAQVARGDEVLAAARAQSVDVALLDIEMPGMTGIEAAGVLRRELPAVKIVVVTTFGRPGYLRRAMEAGADAFLVKDAPAAQLAAAVRRVVMRRTRHRPRPGRRRARGRRQPADRTRTGRAARRGGRFHQRRDRRGPPPLPRNGPQLPLDRHPEDRRPQPGGRGTDRGRQGLAVGGTPNPNPNRGRGRGRVGAPATARRGVARRVRWGGKRRPGASAPPRRPADTEVETLVRGRARLLRSPAEVCAERARSGRTCGRVGRGPGRRHPTDAREARPEP